MSPIPSYSNLSSLACFTSSRLLSCPYRSLDKFSPHQHSHAGPEISPGKGIEIKIDSGTHFRRHRGARRVEGKEMVTSGGASRRTFPPSFLSPLSLLHPTPRHDTSALFSFPPLTPTFRESWRERRKDNIQYMWNTS